MAGFKGRDLLRTDTAPLNVRVSHIQSDMCTYILEQMNVAVARQIWSGTLKSPKFIPGRLNYCLVHPVTHSLTSCKML